ncbi:substrate-binding domain-containing protein [Acetivibrio saccincola]|uniref:Sugar ABC transporter substrate-binding protein n=1 Tax=Acetivibrio saccincola TaxID=1677857 RepID=A0A2S8R816_9FIRM|nr:substrate-binding domain-containing protein [Acetivibrio saccincola]PQQ65940.1 sugar ABC transporter substrate-binding protein [Acetivibrio saccincola]
MRKFLALVLVITLALSLVACGSGSASGDNNTHGNNTDGNNKVANDTGGKTGGYVGNPSDEYFMVTFLSGIDYWKYCFEGFEDAAKNIGVTAKYTGQTDTDVAGQVAVLEQVIAQNPKGIAVTAVNTTALADTIDSAIEKGISVVCFDSDSPTSKRSAYLGTGNYVAGQKSAEFLVPLVDYKGKIAVLYTVGAENSESRVQGFEDWCKENAPEVSLVKVNNAGDTTVGADNLAAALQANDDIVGVFCVDGVAGTAGPTAVAESKKDIRVLAFDVDVTVLDKVKSGEIDGTVAQGMYNMGYWSMMMLYTEANGLSDKALPENLDTGVVIVTKENVDEYYPKK